MARATNDLLALRMVAGPAIMYLVDTTVRTIMIVPMMLALSPSLTLWALLPTLGLPLVMVIIGGEVHRRALAVQDQFGDISSFVQEHLAGVRIVRAYAQESAETALFHGLDRGYVASNLALARGQGIFHPLLTFLGGLGAVIAMIFGGRTGPHRRHDHRRLRGVRCLPRHARLADDRARMGNLATPTR